MKNTQCKRWIIFILLIIAILFPTSIAVANAPYPPFRMWFQFSSETKSDLQITGAQMIGCYDKYCDTPYVLANFGDTTGSTYLAPTSNDLVWELKCAEDQCFAENWGEEWTPLFFRLITTSDSKTWTTNIAPFPDCSRCTTYWNITLAENSVLLEEPENVEDAKSSLDSLLTFLLSVTAEILVALGYGLFLRKYRPLSIPKLLTTVFFANLLSYYFVWAIFPMFGKLKFDNDRSYAIVAIIALIIVSLFTIWVVHNWKNSKLEVGIITAVFIPVFSIMFLFVAFESSYGYGQIQVGGLPNYMVIIVAEIFAVIYETIMVYFLRKKEITFWQSALLCFTANCLSCALGLLI
jgi:hypothetical protein